MKNIKKILACVMAVATLGALTVFPMSTNAIILDNNVNFDDYGTDYKYIIQEAVFVVDNGLYSAKYYFNSNDGFLPQKVDDDFDTSNVEIVINVNEETNGFIVDTPVDYYAYIYYNFSESDDASVHCWLMEATTIEKSTIDYSEYEQNSYTEVILDIKDDEYSKKYYVNTAFGEGIFPARIIDENGNIQKISYEDEDKFNSIINNVDLSTIQTVTFDKTICTESINLEFETYYTKLVYDFSQHELLLQENNIPKTTIDESDNIGDSTEIIGGSDTGIRGDINYDGKVNVSDLIYLRRYLLHLIKW